MYDINLITTIIGFGMSSIFIVFVCTRLICRRLHVTEPRGAVGSETEIDLEQAEQRTDGLEPVVVAAIPTMKFHRDAFSSADDSQCSICLGEYQEKEVLRIMPKCGHSFHLSCIDPWLTKQSTCPVCRLPLKDSFDAKLGRMDVNVEVPMEVYDQSFLPGARYTSGNVSSQQHFLSTSSSQEYNLHNSSSLGMHNRL